MVRWFLQSIIIWQLLASCLWCLLTSADRRVFCFVNERACTCILCCCLPISLVLITHLTPNTGNSASNSSGGVETTSLRPFSRWSLCNSMRTNKYQTKGAPRCGSGGGGAAYVAQYNTKGWVVTTTTWNRGHCGGYHEGVCHNDDISGSSLVDITELETETTETVMWIKNMLVFFVFVTCNCCERDVYLIWGTNKKRVK